MRFDLALSRLSARQQPAFSANTRPRDAALSAHFLNRHDERAEGHPARVKVEGMLAKIDAFKAKNEALGQLMVSPDVTLDAIEYKADRQLGDWAGSAAGRQKLSGFLDDLAKVVDPASELGSLAAAENRPEVLFLMAEAASAWVLAPRWLLGNYGQQCRNIIIAQGDNPYCFSARRDILTRDLQIDDRLEQFSAYETLLKGLTGNADLKDPVVQKELASALYKSVTMPLQSRQIRDALSPLLRIF